MSPENFLDQVKNYITKNSISWVKTTVTLPSIHQILRIYNNLCFLRQFNAPLIIVSALEMKIHVTV